MSNGEDPRERRTAPRFTLRVPVVIEGRGISGAGRVENISAAGVRIEDTQVRPMEGARLTVHVALRQGANRLQLAGEVIRITKSGGFCLNFVDMDPRVRHTLSTALPRLADGVSRLDDESEAELSGQLELALGQALHSQIAQLAESAGVNPTEWARSQLAVSAEAASRETRGHDRSKRPGHDPATCADCIRERRGEGQR